MKNHEDLEWKRFVGKWNCDKIREERYNFWFLTDGSMVYPYNAFDSYWDAMIDSIKNHGTDIDDLINLVFPEKVDHPIVKEKLLKAINEK